MDRIALRTIIDGMNELQKECRRNNFCTTCMFYDSEDSCYISRCMRDDPENIGKKLSLQYLK